MSTWFEFSAIIIYITDRLVAVTVPLMCIAAPHMCNVHADLQIKCIFSLAFARVILAHSEFETACKITRSQSTRTH